MIEAELPDGTILEFPDGTPDDVIQAAVRKQLNVQTEPTIAGAAKQSLGTSEALGSMISGAIAEPIAGIAGLFVTPFTDVDTGVQTINKVRDLLTYDPRTDAGKQRLQQIGQVLEPVAEGLENVSEFTGDLGFNTAKQLGADDETAAAFGAAGKTAPSALLEALGFKGLRSSTLRKTVDAPVNVKQAVRQSAPTVKQIRDKANQLYTQLDNSGVKIKPQVYDNFVSSLEKSISKEIDAGLHPKSAAVLKRLKSEAGEAKSFIDMNNLRQLAADAAFTIDQSDARIGKKILNRIDDGIDRISEAAGGDARGARSLWRRARVSETIGDMIENASMTASGFENGLRIEARKILKSKKRQRGFSKAELQALKDLENGSTAQNAAKFLGKFGISEGQATSMLGAAISSGAGGAMFGSAGAVGLPAIGQIGKNVAQKLTLNKAKFADELVRAGGNARDIAKAYMKNTPRSAQRVEDLTALLLDPNVTIESIKSLPASSKLLEDAKYFAIKARESAERNAARSAMALPIAMGEEDENDQTN